MSKLLRVGLGVVVVGVVSIVVAGCGGGASTRHSYPVLGINNWATDWPGGAAPAAAAAQAERVASRSRLVHRLVGDHRHPTGSFVWLGSQSSPAVVVLRYPIAKPRRLNVIVPYAMNPPEAPASGDCKHPYAPGWERLTTSKVKIVFVGVDVRSNRIADVRTDAKSGTMSPVPGRPYPQCQEG